MATNPDAALDELARGLTAALGDGLVSLMLYGSSARGTQVAGRSGLDVLLVLKDAGAAALHKAAPVLAAWARGGNPPPLIQSEADWKASADVFPIEVEDIREAHRVLAGRDVTAEVTTTRDDQRRELEREARGKLIRLRAEYAVAAGDGATLAELLARASGTFLVLFRAALRLQGGPLPEAPAEVVRATARAAGFDPQPFERALGSRASVPAPALQAHDAAAAAYLEAVQKFVAWIDQA